MKVKDVWTLKGAHLTAQEVSTLECKNDFQNSQLNHENHLRSSGEECPPISAFRS